MRWRYRVSRKPQGQRCNAPMIMLRKPRRYGLKLFFRIDELLREHIERKLIEGNSALLGMQNKIYFIFILSEYFKINIEENKYVFLVCTFNNLYLFQ